MTFNKYGSIDEFSADFWILLVELGYAPLFIFFLIRYGMTTNFFLQLFINVPILFILTIIIVDGLFLRIWNDDITFNSDGKAIKIVKRITSDSPFEYMTFVIIPFVILICSNSNDLLHWVLVNTYFIYVMYIFYTYPEILLKNPLFLFFGYKEAFIFKFESGNDEKEYIGLTNSDFRCYRGQSIRTYREYNDVYVIKYENE